MGTLKTKEILAPIGSFGFKVIFYAGLGLLAINTAAELMGPFHGRIDNGDGDSIDVLNRKTFARRKCCENNQLVLSLV